MKTTEPYATKGILKEIEVSGAIAEADAMIVVTHCKGHELSGFGGAIKNLGMGGCPGAGKLRQHRTVGIEIDQSKCVGCGKCKAACPMNLPEIVEGKARNISGACMRCPICKTRSGDALVKDGRVSIAAAPEEADVVLRVSLRRVMTARWPPRIRPTQGSPGNSSSTSIRRAP